MRANITRVTSPTNSTIGSFHLISSVPFSHFLFIFYLPRCTLPNFLSDSSLASLPLRQISSYLILTLLLYFLFIFTFPGAPYWIFYLYLPRLSCHFYLVIEQQSNITRVTSPTNSTSYIQDGSHLTFS